MNSVSRWLLGVSVITAAFAGCSSSSTAGTAGASGVGGAGGSGGAAGTGTGGGGGGTGGAGRAGSGGSAGIGTGAGGGTTGSADMLLPISTTQHIDVARFPVPRRPYMPLAGGRILHVAPGGSGDGSEASPLGSINAAVDAAMPGDVILIAGGDYTLRDSTRTFALTMDKQGVVLAARDGERVKVTPGGNHTYGIELKADGVIVDGFEMTGFSSLGIQFGRTDSPQQQVQILRTTVHGGQDAIRSVVVDNGRTQPIIEGLLLYQVQLDDFGIGFNCGEGPCNDVRIERVTVRGRGMATGNSGSDCVAFENGRNLAFVDVDVSGAGADGIDTKADDVVVMNANVHDVARNGVKLWRGGDVINSLVVNTGADAAVVFDQPGDYRILNSTISRHAGENSYVMTVAYDTRGPGTLQIINSIFADNSGPIFVPSQFTLTIKNSIFHGAHDGAEFDIEGMRFGAGAERPLSALTSAMGFSMIRDVDPMFTAPTSGDFTLKAGSPALDTGVDAMPAPTFDILERPRKVGAAVDLGPFEKQ